MTRQEPEEASKPSITLDELQIALRRAERVIEEELDDLSLLTGMLMRVEIDDTQFAPRQFSYKVYIVAETSGSIRGAW